MASFGLLAIPPSPVLMSAAANKGEKKGLFDWLTDALDKNEILETDPILRRADDAKNGAPPKSSPAPKKSPPPKKQGGGGFFGLGKK